MTAGFRGAPLRFWGPLLLTVMLCGMGAAQPTALDRYVAEFDPAYSYRVAATTPGLGYTTYVLEMTSQTWRSPAEVDRPVWRHWLLIAVPSQVRTSTALLLINAGSNSDPQPTQVDFQLGLAANLAGAVLAELRLVPNQPLRFSDETRTRSEDAIIAYTWDKYLRTGDEKWPAQLPMTKAAVRAMDTVTDFCRSAAAGVHTVDKFVVAGGSKRGWATWSTAAVDSRVVGIMPLVIDVLNLEQSFLHHWQAYGFWAPAVHDYEEAGIMSWLGTTQIRALQSIIDPYMYRARYTMPKYIVNASGDEFFLPDSSRFYFDDLPGQKYLRYVPNTGHGLDNPDVITGCLTFFQYLIAGTQFPRFSWEFLQDGGIRLTVQDAPSEVRLWQATNRTARDFRVETIGTTWTSSVLVQSSQSVYEGRIAPPAQGWSAFFLELTYPGALFPLKFSTAVRVIPDTLAFPKPLGAVSAANYVPLTAPESIASAFGESLSATTESATQLPLPNSLGEVSVRLSDSKGNTQFAPLFFVSPAQVNYLTPAGAATGLARVEVTRGGQTVMKGQTLIEQSAPALFSANADGRGVAAAIAVRYAPDNSQSWDYAFQCGSTIGSCVPKPVDLGPDTYRVYLQLFGTGIRGRSSLGAVSAKVGGTDAEIQYAGPQGNLAGLDQVNVLLPRALRGRGEVDLILTVGGRTANTVQISIQ